MVRRPPASSPFPHTTPFRLKTETVHPASLYSVKLIVPVGLLPRVRCATSDTCPPAATEPLAVVVSAGAAFVTTTASPASAQTVGPPVLLSWSPEQLVRQW